MRSRLGLALLLSAALHAASLLSLQLPADWDTPEIEGEAQRLAARFVPPAPAAPAAPRAVPRQVRPDPGAMPAQMPVPAPAASAPEAASSEPAPAESAPAPAASSSSSSSASAEASLLDRLAESGHIVYRGSAGGFLGVEARGEASWQLLGTRLASRLTAGLSGTDTALVYTASSDVVGTLLQSVESDDQRMSKRSHASIDQASGVVTLKRGDDTRTRHIEGLAVAVAALPQLLAGFDENATKVAVFVVGDFWVEDAEVVRLEDETLRLAEGRVATRHYQSRIKGGKLIDIWLAPRWRNAPARIRMQFEGWVLDLRAESVEIEGQRLLEAPPPRND